MHVIEDYSGLSVEQQRQRALADLRDFFGEERFEEVSKSFPKPKMSYALFDKWACFAGVQGLPVRFWYEYVYGILPAKGLEGLNNG